MNEISVGNQIWASENLNQLTFRNGESIPIADNWETWSKYSSKGHPCCAYVDNKISNRKYGILYNGFCILDIRNISPDGYRILNIKDILEMTHFLGFPNVIEDRVYYNNDIAFGLKGNKLWKKTFFGEPGDNSTGLNFLPGGNLTARDGMFIFDDKGTTAGHWLLDQEMPKEGLRHFPPLPTDWPQERLHQFTIGTSGDNSLSIGSSFAAKAHFIRLIKE